MAEKSPIRKTDGISKQEKTVAALVKQEKRHFLKWIKSEFYPLIRSFQQKGKKGDFPSIEKYYRNGKSSRNPSKKEKRPPFFVTRLKVLQQKNRIGHLLDTIHPLIWCGWWDLNPHEIALTSPSSWRVCRSATTACTRSKWSGQEE